MSDIQVGDVYQFEGTIVRLLSSFEYNPAYVLNMPGNNREIWLYEDAIKAAKLIKRALPKPGEWTGPGLTPIYEITFPTLEKWHPIAGEVVEYGVHRIITNKGAKYNPTIPKLQVRRIKK